MTCNEICHDNGTVIDLKKIAYARFFWRVYPKCGEIIERTIRPDKPTVNGNVIEPEDLALNHPDFPNETLMQRAKRLDILDKWVPVWKAVFCNGHSVEFTWSKAKSMDEAWRAYVFNKKKNK